MDKREARQRVRERNGIPDPGDGLAGHEDIENCLSAALIDISSQHRWPWLLTSASVTFTDGVGPIPTGCTTIHKLVVNDAPAARVSLDQFLAEQDQYVWTELGANIKLYPVPTTAPTATLYYYQAEPALTVDTSTPLLPAQWHQVWVVRASLLLNIRRGQFERVTRDEEDWGQGVRDMMQATWSSLGPRQIRSGFRAQRLARW
jgi:hypothetical protein